MRFAVTEMNWMTVTWPMVSAACLTLALINLRVAMGDGRRAPHVFFFFAALAVAAVSGMELALLQTDDLGRYQSLLRWAAVPIGIMVVSVTGFVWSFFGTGRAWLALAGSGLLLLAQIANLVTQVPAVRHAIAIRKVEAFGVDFTIATVATGPWSVIEIVAVVMVMAFVLDASVSLARRGGRRRAAIVGGSIIFFFLVSRGHALLVEKGMVETPYFVSFAFLGVLIAMGHELGGDVLRAARLAHELRESEQRIGLAARAATLGFWTWDIARDEIWASATARMLFGVTPDERIDLRRFLGLLHPEDRGAVGQAIETALAGGLEYEKEYRVPAAAGGVRWIAARGRAEPGANGQPVLMRGVVMDITSQRHSEIELQSVRSQLAHAGRVSMMGQLASALAHELNQPLGAILRNVEAAEIFLREATPDIEELRAIVSDIRSDDQRAGEVIDRLRSMLKRRDLESRPLAVGELLSEATALARADAAARRVTIEIAAAPGLPAVNGDRVHLQQVLLNLVLNAMDAMNGGDGQRKVILRAGPGGAGAVEISVCDTGHGIPAEKLADVFEPFYTTKSHGMGLGLAISRTIIEAHGGRIWAENNAGGGATFRFTLPVAEGKTAA